MVRILCLHGIGTNSEILELSFKHIRSLLPQNWVFEYLDGEVPCTPFLEVAKSFPGPYLGYYDAPTVEAVTDAVNLILEIAREDGPFDAVLGFSQGCSLALTALAAAAERFPTRPPPFKCAILFNSVTPYRLGSGPLYVEHDLAAKGHDVVVSARRADFDETNTAYDIWTDPEAAPFVQELQVRQVEMRGTTKEKGSGQYHLALHPDIHGIRVFVPTLHVYGENDTEYKTQSRQASELCDPAPGRKVITHNGGHFFPKDMPTVAKVVNAIEWVVERAAQTL